MTTDPPVDAGGAPGLWAEDPFHGLLQWAPFALGRPGQVAALLKCRRKAEEGRPFFEKPTIALIDALPPGVTREFADYLRELVKVTEAEWVAVFFPVEGRALALVYEHENGTSIRCEARFVSVGGRSVLAPFVRVPFRPAGQIQRIHYRAPSSFN